MTVITIGLSLSGILLWHNNCISGVFNLLLYGNRGRLSTYLCHAPGVTAACYLLPQQHPSQSSPSLLHVRLQGGMAYDLLLVLFAGLGTVEYAYCYTFKSTCAMSSWFRLVYYLSILFQVCVHTKFAQYTILHDLTYK